MEEWSPCGRTSFQTRTTGIYRSMISEWRRQLKSAVLAVTVSDLQAWTYTILDWQMTLCARNTSFFLFFLFSRTTVFLAGPHAVCPFGMADWLNRLRAFIIYTVFLIKKKKCKKKSSVASAASSVALHGLPEADHCEQRIEYRTRNSEASYSIPSLASDCG